MITTTNAVEPVSTSEDLFADVRAALVAPARRSSLLLLVTLGLFILTQVAVHASMLTIVGLVAILLFHELGHYCGMLAFKYRDVKMFFIPMLGAAVSGKRTGIATWKEGIVLLLGPLPGIVLGTVPVARTSSTAEWSHSAVSMLLLINGFNLLPLGNLDGGRLWQCVLTSRQRGLDLSFSFITTLLLAWLAMRIHARILTILALLWLFLAMNSARYRWRVAKAAGALDERYKGATDCRQLDEGLGRELCLTAGTLLGPKHNQNAGRIAITMQAILDAHRPRPSTRASVLLLGSWLAGLLLAIGAFGVHASIQPSALKLTQTLQQSNLSVSMPFRPIVNRPVDIGTHALGLEGYSNGGGLFRTYTVSTWKLVDCPEAVRAWLLQVLLHEVGDKSLATEVNSFRTIERLGFKGAEISGKLGNQTCRLRALMSADRAVRLVACASKEEPQMEQFLESLRPATDH